MTDREPPYPAVRRDGVLRVGRPGTEWLSSGWNGGRRHTDCVYNVSVPDGWSRTDLEVYAGERLERAGFERENGESPVLFTGVDLEHARGAQCGSVTAYATAGLSNPAQLPMEAAGRSLPDESDRSDERTRPGTGTVNLVVGTTRALAPGALANLLAVAVEAKATTLLTETGFPGTTTDAVVVGHDPSGEPTPFSGSGTRVGAATRACVREAVRASLRSRYGGDAEIPGSVDDATYGTSTDASATVFRPPLASVDPRET
ncbi:adenosylcobinamide amidohydrolase [Natrarchaeobius sp. A-rgal3]|uniref:adenosylcobinamide amidohydrolase n=1 Tax=Natrarchaeobius versutus TaxID=1679078 RepID=UPI00350EA1F4